MTKKYKLVNEKGTHLKRLVALQDIGLWVKRRDRGGLIESENNLSHEGDCWVFEGAAVLGDAEVSGNAEIKGVAEVFGGASVRENAIICENAKVYGNADVSGNAKVGGSARVYKYAEVSGNAKVGGNARIGETDRIGGNIDISGPTTIKNNKPSGFKDTSGKSKYSKLPVKAALDLTLPVRMYGINKYGDNDGWRTSVKYEDYQEALFRHVLKMIDGQELDLNEKGEVDKDHSGLPHLAHVLCTAMFMSQLLKDKKDDKNKG